MELKSYSYLLMYDFNVILQTNNKNSILIWNLENHTLSGAGVMAYQANPPSAAPASLIGIGSSIRCSSYLFTPKEGSREWFCTYVGDPKKIPAGSQLQTGPALTNAAI